jgi:hypothetical protein
LQLPSMASGVERSTFPPGKSPLGPRR